jgi:hypothetical protein
MGHLQSSCAKHRRRPGRTPIFFLSYLPFLVTLSSSAINRHHHLAPPPSASPRMVPRSAPGDASAGRGGVHARHRGGRPEACCAAAGPRAGRAPAAGRPAAPRAGVRGRDAHARHGRRRGAWRRHRGGGRAAGAARVGVPQPPRVRAAPPGNARLRLAA